MPGFINWPNKIEPSEVKECVHIIDWFPTLANIIGYKTEKRVDWDGLDLSPVLFGKKSLMDRDLYWIWRTKIDRWALRHKEWKIVKYGRGEPKLREWRLYNIAEDPYEKKDIASKHPKQLMRMHERFVSQRSKDLLKEKN